RRLCGCHLVYRSVSDGSCASRALRRRRDRLIKRHQQLPRRLLRRHSHGLLTYLDLWNAACKSLPGVPFSRACISLPFRKAGNHFSGTLTLAPVLGLRPGRADRVFTENAPKPRNSTRLPLANAAEISSRTALMTFSASRT